MDWTAFATDTTGWSVSVGLALLVVRSLIRGDLVTGREYDRLAAQLDRTTERADSLVDEQRREAAAERSRLLDRIEELEHAARGGSA